MITPIITLRPKRIIVDVDTQRHFFIDRSLVCVQNHLQVLANIRKVMGWAQSRNIHTISTLQICGGNDRYYNSRIFGTECQQKLSLTLRNRHISFDANDCTDLPPEILEQYDQVIFHKRCFDPFMEPRADRMLSELQADEFILIGAATEGAVKATALGLLTREKNVTVLVDATGSYNQAVGEITLRLLLERGAKLTDTKTLTGSCCLRLGQAHYSARS
jgi:nicotinamidase-related amidase